MKDDEIKRIIIGILVICIIIMFCFLIYLIFFKLEKIESGVQEINEPKEKLVNTFEHLVGEYEFIEEGEVRKFVISPDGYGKYTYEDFCGEEKCNYQEASGKVGIGKGKIYLMNDNCHSTIKNDSCEYLDCRTVIEFDYNDDLIMIDGLVLLRK